MESLAILLEPHKELIGTLAFYAGNINRLSVLPVLISIHKGNSSAGHSLRPFLAGVVLSILTIRYANIISDGLIFRANLITLVLNLAYMSFYYWYTNTSADRKAFWTKAVYGAIVAAAVISYSMIENPIHLQKRYEGIVIAILFCSVGSPLLHLREMIRNKTTGDLSFSITLGGTIVSFLMVLYCIVIRIGVLIFTQSVLFLLSAIQLSLFVIFPSKPKKSSEKTD